MKFSVITTIQSPTKAIAAYADQPDFQLIVVGDKKTPKDWQHKKTIFLGMDTSSVADFALTGLLPYNHYSRKNLGYLYAMQQGASAIFETDDDNIPYGDISFPSSKGIYDTVKKDDAFFNIYQMFTAKESLPIWPRGLPLRQILAQEEMTAVPREVHVAIWQGLADEDPDVDAIYRLTRHVPCTFIRRTPIVLDIETYCPYNSQNTLHFKEAFPLLYIPSTVSFRFTDILRGIIAQPILHCYGYHLGFTQATVRQERNEHDFMLDFRSEIPMYLHVEEVKNIARDTVSPKRDMGSNLIQIYEALYKSSIVQENELVFVEAWLHDCEYLTN